MYLYVNGQKLQPTTCYNLGPRIFLTVARDASKRAWGQGLKSYFSDQIAARFVQRISKATFPAQSQRPCDVIEILLDIARTQDVF